MFSEGTVTMLSEMGLRSMIGNGGDRFGGGEEMERELGMLLRDSRQQEAIDRERELNIFRSGSAPPTVEGSLNAVGGLFGREMPGSGIADISEANDLNGFMTEEELLSSPEYLSYYYSHVNLNPRLPPPLLSKEDWRSAQRLQAGSSGYGGIGDKWKMNHREDAGRRSLFSQQPGFDLQEEHVDSRNVADSGEWIDKGDGLIGLSLVRQKSFADALQEDLGRKTPVPTHPSRPTSRNTFANELESLGSADTQIALDNEGVNEVHKVAGSSSNSFTSVIGSSIMRSTTPDPQLVTRALSPGLPPVSVRANATDRKANNYSSFNGASSVRVESDSLISSLSGLSLSNDGIVADDKFLQSKLQKKIDDQHNFLFSSQSGQNNIKTNPIYSNSEFFNMPSNQQSGKSSYPGSTNISGGASNIRSSKVRLNGPAESQRSTAASANSFLKASSGSFIGSPGGSPANHQNLDGAFANYGLNPYAVNPALPSLLASNVGTGNLPLSESIAAASSILTLGIDSRSLGNNVFAPPNLVGSSDLQNFPVMGNQTGAAALQGGALNDPLYLQYLKAAEYTTKAGANINDLSMERGYAGNSLPDLLEVHKAYLGTLLQTQKQSNMPVLGKSGALNHGYYGNPAFGLGMTYPGSPLASPIASPVGPGSPLRLGGERNLCYAAGLRNLSGGVLGSWNYGPSGKTDEHFPSSLLEEFKNTKTRCFELAEIAGHVVEFSADQYGSRFIQQKLETATTEEKDMVFEEIMPHALSLMTDVFGNYVVQKFFEHGSAAQRRELANNLIGHVLALSLQMYGCRVIQKAIEVVDLDQKTVMVSELDGHVMRCVRDQNGNHVIQKCIECVPQEEIQFIISTFYDHIVMLSTHPYGCRVIQRVLEHCDDPKTQQIVMDEILRSVCMLAQDQYGNYVVQHVLEHGKPHERSEIIRKLAGQIVQMSQQKFASNVVEKCLTFGGLEERQILVNEMLGSTDENEPLQAMMKDQFANYVVQKVLETCDDQQRELILSRIKVHLSALKKYTYGKHIVARVEKLVAAGERRIGLQSS